MSGQFEKGMAAPDLMCVCIDRRDTAGSSGRLYSRYTERPQNFVNEYQLLRFMDGLMDAIDYPQSSVEMRSYGKPPIVDKKRKQTLYKFGRSDRTERTVRNISGTCPIQTKCHLAG